ncbi:MAG: asparagine synthase (glutamine-hydrolyzing) [Hyphomicrobiaceae bacterium]|nr:asparagine synthase (glutamine-hydrolyzing) [Hyphomicrobiaceae bacterium]
MCGIAGYFDVESRARRPDSAAIAARQIAAIRYRGPDAAGLHVGPGLALAHARLSIIDTSAAANQPMLDGAGDLAVVFNGEIYNFASLRAELEAKGHEFRTRSDTEVIIEGYRAWGTDVVRRLRGMFAIALYDRKSDRLVLMRDRLGKKPLTYGYVGSTLVFGSELKAVLAFPGMERRADLAAIDAYLTYQYVPTDLCAFEGLAKIPPAHVGVIERHGRLRLERYWSLPEPARVRAYPEADVAEELTRRLEEATRLRLVADVPLGAFLSGGVDSSAVVAMMAGASSGPVRTFTIGFDEASHDERRYARMVAERYGTVHEELEVKADAAAIVETLAYHYDEPFADASAVPTYAVSKIAREQVTVVLTGDGGDECFLGYERYRAVGRLDRLARLPRSVLEAARTVLALLPAASDRVKLVRRVKRVGESLGGSRSQRYGAFIAYFDDAAKRALYAGDLEPFLARSALERLEPWLSAAEAMPQAAAWADVHTYLPDDLLVKMDIASMASSLETRAPFLDHQLMEWAAGLPVGQRMPGGEPKGLLKRALESHLPRELLYRPKMGFAAPIDGWIDAGLRERVEDTLLSSRARARGLFEAQAVERLLARHRAGQRQGYRIWALLMLELWHRQWIDAADPLVEPIARRVLERYRSAEVAAD